jgi:hypothetical protein
MRSWFASRWRSQVPAARLVWHDMWLVGTLVNLAASVSAMILYARGLGAVLAMSLHFATLPYNAFLVACLWRHPSRTTLQIVLALLWFGVMAVV